MNIALRLTIFRLAVIPFFVYFIYSCDFYSRLLALILFTAGMISDAYDGYFARKRNEITVLGMFLDPLADKLLISAALISFVGIKELHIPSWMVIVIISREFLITGLRTLGASQGMIIPADKAGKFKTTSQTVGTIIILVILVIRAYLGSREPADKKIFLEVISPVPFILMFVMTLLTFYSGARYISRYKYIFTKKI